MPLRFYVSNLAAGYTPPTLRGTWSDGTLTGASKLSLVKGGASASAGRAETSSSSSWTVLLRRFVSDPANNAATLSGAMSLCVGVAEGNTGMNANTRVYAYVTVGDTNVVRGVLTASAVNGVGEWPAPSALVTARGMLMTIPSISSVDIQPGDRIVVELGYRAANTSTSSWTGVMWYGATGLDLVDSHMEVQVRAGWVEFSGAGFITAFSPPLRSGSTTTTLSVGSSLPLGRKKVVAVTTTETLVDGDDSPVARKAMKTTTAAHIANSTAGSIHLGVGEPVTQPSISFPGEAYHDSFGGETVTEVGVGHVTYTVLPGSIEPDNPDVELLTAPPRPNPRIPVRFIAQDIRTRRFLDWDLPLVNPEITYNLSGAKIIKAKLKPEFSSISELGIEPWATYIHVEEDGEIRGSGILLPASVDDEEYDVTAIGVSGYAKGMPYFAEDQLVQIDVCDVLRRIWGHLQSFPDANLGVYIPPDVMSGTLLGIPRRQARDPDTGELKWTEEKIDLGSEDYDDGQGGTVSVPNQPPYDPGYYEDAEGNLYLVRYDPFEVNGEVYALKVLILLHPVIEEAKPYVLAWYDDRDCGAEFDNLCRIAKVEYLEIDRWNEARTDVQHFIELAYPRAGRKRFDLRVALDENLLQAFILSESDDQYASEILVRGRGKGRAAVRGYGGYSDNHRVRRVKIVSDPTIRTPELANEYAVDAALRARKVVTIGELVLDANHPNMPLGSYQPGDDVLVSARVAYAGDLELWHRIVSFTWKPDSDTVVAQVRRSEQFVYGRPVSGVTEGDPV